MARSQTKQKLNATTPKFSTPPGVENQDCTITFGHNTDIKKVLMQFSVMAERLIFSSDDARDVAKKLNYYADMADGKKVM